ncbi:MAG: homoserine dehydrogenase [Lachnospiraceae bacterium]|uniref:homoserine dehydrogenase n=1 Tax=Parablautia sp. Marseille-Q6255 TaxID=3039593 RepID=UPI0024BC0A64|nr:homoserine dehydrogenase [Parablautia sp. Marseille-Q6255]
MENRKIGIALLGLGTVGFGTYKVLKAQQEEMAYKVGAQAELRRILVRNKAKAVERTGQPELITDSMDDILNDKEIQIVVELIGGIEPARTYIEAALRAGKHVVTANKDLIASDHGRLMDLAKEKHCDLMFEAAVAGAIPVIMPLKQSLAANHLSEVMGIVNGTTNFILTKMSKEGMEFEEALALATKLGYAEADPTADIEGLDAGRKVAIMASIAFNSRVSFEDVATEGITKLSAHDIRYAKEMGCCIKLIGMAHSDGASVEAYVAPMLIPEDHPLASVNDSYNAVFVRGDAVEDAMFLGRGAGELPTASAVAGDVFDVVRNIVHGCNGRISCTCFKHLPVVAMEDVHSKYFLRVEVEDRIGVLADIANVFAGSGVSVEQIIQKQKTGDNTEIVVITDKVREGDFKEAVQRIADHPATRAIRSTIRVYTA